MVSHPFILFFYILTEKINRILYIFHKKIILKNYEINCNAGRFEESVFLENQSGISEMYYGSKSFSHSGCGTAAVYNALLSLGIPMPLPEIIRHFEKYGASVFAAFGTAPWAAIRLLSKKLTPEMFEKCADRRRFKDLAESSDVLIYTIMNNRRKITRMLHTVCVERVSSDGHKSLSPCDNAPGSRFIVHNSHDRAETYSSYEDMMYSLGDGGGMADGVYMVGIRKARS